MLNLIKSNNLDILFKFKKKQKSRKRIVQKSHETYT